MDLMEVILTKENLNRDYKKVVTIKGGSGMDVKDELTRLYNSRLLKNQEEIEEFKNTIEKIVQL